MRSNFWRNFSETVWWNALICHLRRILGGILKDLLEFLVHFMNQFLENSSSGRISPGMSEWFFLHIVKIFPEFWVFLVEFFRRSGISHQHSRRIYPTFRENIQGLARTVFRFRKTFQYSGENLSNILENIFPRFWRGSLQDSGENLSKILGRISPWFRRECFPVSEGIFCKIAELYTPRF